MEVRRCPALMISASASRQGKTTVTAALAYHHRRLGRRVRVFKVGPDFLDPMVLESASGNKVDQLDLWMVGEEECRRLFFQAAAENDLILVEGVMGLFDGTPSSADLAEKFDLPVAIIINASAMAQTFHAIAHGLATFRQQLNIAGVLANGVASERHAEMLRQGGSPAVRYLGALIRSDEIALPERHLGLVQAEEILDLDRKLEAAAGALAKTDLSGLLPASEFSPVSPAPVPRLLEGLRIAVARDACFSFIYPANMRLLERLGARILFFSPLASEALPEADSVYLPGGYPELHLDRLSANEAMKSSIAAHFDAGKPIYAECGGMLYLLESLADKQGRSAGMVGIFPGRAVMQDRLARLGYQEVEFQTGALRGHTFHHSKMETSLEPVTRARHPHGSYEGEAVYRQKGLSASYLHLYFPSNPAAAAQLFLPST